MKCIQSMPLNSCYQQRRPAIHLFIQSIPPEHIPPKAKQRSPRNTPSPGYVAHEPHKYPTSPFESLVHRHIHKGIPQVKRRTQSLGHHDTLRRCSYGVKTTSTLVLDQTFGPPRELFFYHRSIFAKFSSLNTCHRVSSEVTSVCNRN